MKKSEILKEVKDLLWDGYSPVYSLVVSRSQYICFTLEQVGADEEDIVALQKIVLSRLLGNNCFENYLYDTLGEEAYDKLTSVEVQDRRKQFLDVLIAEYEALGQ